MVTYPDKIALYLLQCHVITALLLLGIIACLNSKVANRNYEIVACVWKLKLITWILDLNLTFMKQWIETLKIK